MYDREATHHLVLQDDTVACRSLRRGMEKALTYIPRYPSVSLFYGYPRKIPSQAERRWAAGRAQSAEEAIAKNASWIVLPTVTWGPAILLPTEVIDDMLVWADTRTYPEYDKRVGRYACDVLGWPCWHPWPSPVDHRGTESLCDHGYCGAYRFLGRQRSALRVDWSGPVVWHPDARPEPEPVPVEAPPDTRFMANARARELAQQQKGGR
jgi:hypothetical protein